FRGLNSSIKTNSNNLKYGEKSVENYEKGIQSLNEDIVKQRKNMDDLKAKYEQARQQDGENAASTQRLAAEYNKQADSLNRMEHQLANYTKELNQMKIESSSWYKMGDAMQGFGDKLGGISQKAREVGSTLTKRITLPALGVATAAGGIVAAFGWERLVGLDSAKAQLEGMGYSTKEVGSITDTVTTAIEGGMTTMAEGTAVAAGAMAAGVKEGKDLERYIKLVGDAAVGSNRPVDEMAQIFNRVQGGGKLMTQELNQIEHGMPGFRSEEQRLNSSHVSISYAVIYLLCLITVLRSFPTRRSSDLGSMAAGVKEGKDLERYIKLVGDAAVGSNRPVDEMAQIFNRVQGGGKLMTQELNQIEHGMPGF